jgi:PEP-CTERM motif
MLCLDSGYLGLSMKSLFAFSRGVTFAALAFFVSTAAQAQTVYDAYSSFNGTQGAGNFTYGYTIGGVDTLFETNAGCAISGTTCLHSTINDVGGVPLALASATAFQFSTVAIPDDRLILHPGPNSQAFVRFTVPTTGVYALAAAFNIADDSPTGVGIYFSSFFNGVANSGFVGSLASVGSGNGLSYGFGSLNAGDSLTFRIDNAGNYTNDSIGTRFTATLAAGAVPEPATWFMMLLGFGFVGAVLRRKSTGIAVQNSV